MIMRITWGKLHPGTWREYETVPSRFSQDKGYPVMAQNRVASPLPSPGGRRR